MIISDISKRELLVDSIEEAERIKFGYRKGTKIYSIDIEQVDLGLFKVIITYSVGDYFLK